MHHGLTGLNLLQNIFIAAVAGIPSRVFIFSVLEAAMVANSRELVKRLFGAR
jgi:hypothetical protein